MGWFRREMESSRDRTENVEVMYFYFNLKLKRKKLLDNYK